MNSDLKNMMFACLGHPRCPSSWHSRHLYPFVMLSFQCFVASSLGQSMPHSCSFRDPMRFPFSISGYMPATKIKSLHSTAGSENIWQLCCQNLFHTAITMSKTNVGSSTKSSKKQIQWTLWDHVIPSAFYSFHLISFNPNFKRPIPSQKGILKQQVRIPLSIPKQSRKSPANVRAPSITSSEPRPKRPENPSRATAVFVGRIHLGPRRDQLLDHGGVAFLSRQMQRRPASGAEDATRKAGLLRHRGETKRSNGMFLRVVGQIFLDRS